MFMSMLEVLGVHDYYKEIK